ncbi:MAG: mechanosensitive ion channel family protein [archaeon]
MFWANVLWGNTYHQYLMLIIYIVLGVGVGKIFYFVSSKIVKVLAAKTKSQLDDILSHLLEKPIILMIILAGIYIGAHQLTLSDKAGSVFDRAMIVLFTLNISWIIINFIDAIIINYVQPMAEKTRSDLDDHLLPIIRKLVKIVLWVLAIIMIIKDFGFDVSALITGVGIGGLAFALAAQELLSNLFGGIAILSDKPFKLGDRIRIDQNEGWVREIGMRTTRIETLDGTQLIIPNAQIAKSILENVSREKARKVKLTVGVTYDTPTKKVIQAQKIIHDVVEDHKLTENESIAALSEFGDSSLVIMIIYWIREKNIDKFMDIRNEINLEIKEKFERAGIEMAFPTRTVHIVHDKKKRK